MFEQGVFWLNIKREVSNKADKPELIIFYLIHLSSVLNRGKYVKKNISKLQVLAGDCL